MSRFNPQHRSDRPDPSDLQVHGDRGIDLELVARELAELGEAPPDHGEFGARAEAEIDGVALLLAHAHPVDPSRGLDPVSARRVWARVEIGSRRSPRGGAAFHRGRVALTLLAAAAALALAFAWSGGRPDPSRPDAGEIELMASMAREGLVALGVDEGSASRRTAELRDDYRQRLQGAREVPG